MTLTPPSSAKKNIPLWEKCLSFLNHARQEQFQNAETVQQAYAALKGAITQTPAIPEPYLGMSYLLWRTGHYDSAYFVCQEALKVSPGNKDALQIQAQLEKDPRFKQISQNNGLDFDGLYDEVEALLLKNVHYYLQSQANITPGVVQRPIFEKLSTLVQEIESYIHLLETEFDVSTLQSRLHPLQVLSRRQQKMSSISTQFKTIQAEMETNLELTNQLIHLSVDPENPAEIESKVESLLDRCDLIADQIDDLEKQGHNTASLEQIYNQWIEKVAILQEQLE